MAARNENRNFAWPVNPSHMLYVAPWMRGRCRALYDSITEDFYARVHAITAR